MAAPCACLHWCDGAATCRRGVVKFEYSDPLIASVSFVKLPAYNCLMDWLADSSSGLFDYQVISTDFGVALTVGVSVIFIYGLVFVILALFTIVLTNDWIRVKLWDLFGNMLLGIRDNSTPSAYTVSYVMFVSLF